MASEQNQVPAGTLHPAKFSPGILEVAIEVLRPLPGGTLIDPFAGTGRVHLIQEALPQWRTLGIEIEPEWAACHPQTMLGDATKLPWVVGHRFQAAFTSPAYGNRFADKHFAKDGSTRRSYTHDLRKITGDPERQLHPRNGGGYPFGFEYRRLHGAAWRELDRVMVDSGVILLNVSNFIQNHREVDVVSWHVGFFEGLGWRPRKKIEIETPRFGFGSNAKARVGCEYLVVLDKPTRV